MNRDYVPDNWAIVEVHDAKNDKTHWRLAAGWAGGYTQGRSWKINSGIASYTKDEDGYYVFVGVSNNVYYCHEQQLGLDGYTAGIVESYDTQMKEASVGYMKVIPLEDFIDKFSKV